MAKRTSGNTENYRPPAQQQDQPGPSKGHDEQSTASLAQAKTARGDPPAAAPEYITEADRAYNDVEEGVPLVCADTIRHTFPRSVPVVTAIICPHGHLYPDDCPMCREENKKQMAELVADLHRQV